MIDPSLKQSEEIGAVAYTAYCESVGGLAFNGDPLPDWDTFRADPTKKVQSEAWVTAGGAACEEYLLQIVTHIQDVRQTDEKIRRDNLRGGLN